jgi:hypothetical protein
MPVCIDTSVKLFVFLFVCGVSLSAGSLIDTMTDLQSSVNPSTNASTNVTADTCFSIQFGTKPCEEKQKKAIEKVASYFTHQANTAVVHAAVQPGSNSQNAEKFHGGTPCPISKPFFQHCDKEFLLKFPDHSLIKLKRYRQRNDLLGIKSLIDKALIKQGPQDPSSSQTGDLPTSSCHGLGLLARAASDAEKKLTCRQTTKESQRPSPSG